MFRTISINKDFQSLNVEKSMHKQKAYAIVIDEATIGEDIDDYIDEKNVEENNVVLSIEKVDEKNQELRKS